MATSEQLPDSSSGFRSRIRRLLASRWMIPVAIVLALTLSHRSIYNGLHIDDLFHRAILAGSERFGEDMKKPQAMFRFLSGDREYARKMMDVGSLPWWTDPKIKAEFLQFFPTQTHILDYLLWPESPVLMHVHSLAWFALLIFLVAIYYRRILGPTWMAGLAALMFAVEDGHGMPIGWICNRNILIATSFGIGSLMAHDVWRRNGKQWGFWLSLILWACCLCSKEAGIATSAYLFAYALWLDKATLWQRFLTMVPYGIVLVIWRVVRDSLGFGVENLGLYVDPISDPARFAWVMLERYPVYLLGQVGIPSDMSILFPTLMGSPLWWTAIAVVGVLVVLVWPVLRTDATARYFATGMLLSVIPICATIPNDRLLMYVGIGAFGLLARFCNAIFVSTEHRPQWPGWRFVAVPVAVLLLISNLVVSPFLFTLRARAVMILEPLYVQTRFEESLKDQDLIVVNSPIPMAASYCLLTYEHDKMPAPRAVRTLAPGITPVIVKRTDDRTIEVTTDYLSGLGRLFRNEDNPLPIGEPVKIARMTATVLERQADRPTRVAFRFEVPLEDPSLRWLCFREGQYVPWTPPAIGEEVTLKSDWQPKLKW